MNNLTYFQQEPQIQCNLKEQKYELYRLNNEEYYELSKLSFPIQFDGLYLIRLEQYFASKKEALNLAQIHVILTTIAGKTSRFYDDWKGSFCFPFALKIEKNNRILDNYMLIFSDWRGNLEFRFKRLLTEDEIKQGLKRDVFRKPLDDEFSEQEIKDLILYLYNYFIGYFESIQKILTWENFFKRIDSNIILYGYQDGEFWEEDYQDQDDYNQRIEELKSKGIKETFTIESDFNPQAEIKETSEYQWIKKMINRQIKRLLGEISSDSENRINQLHINLLENLALDLMDFKTENDLINWLNNQNLGEKEMKE
jgi:Domain of unknown function (DUF4351)